MTGLISSVDGRHYCALTGMQTTDENSAYAKKRRTRRVQTEGSICMRKYDHFFLIGQDEPCKDRQGHGSRPGRYASSSMGEK